MDAGATEARCDWLSSVGTDDVLADQSKITNFQRQLRAHGLAGRYCLLYQKPVADTHDLTAACRISKRELLERPADRMSCSISHIQSIRRCS
jgi:hypothetical protein